MRHSSPKFPLFSVPRSPVWNKERDLLTALGRYRGALEGVRFLGISGEEPVGGARAIVNTRFMSTVTHRILRHTSRPARYTGGEWNSISKPWDSVRVRVCLAFPDIYEIGLSRPAFASLYQTLNDNPSVLAERAFAPWPDFARTLRSEGLPLTSLESGRPLGDFDIVAVCLPRELAATTVLELLDLGGIPVDAEKRDEQHPLVIAWEEAPINPEPLTSFVDAFLVGDAEVLFPGVVDAWRDLDGETGRPPSRSDLLRRLTSQTGIYVPSLHDTEEDRVQRVVWADLAPVPTHPILPYIQAMPDWPVVELQRGCAPASEDAGLGLALPPLRVRSCQAAVDAVRATLQSTGAEEVGLSASCFSDYPDVEALVADASQVCSAMNAKLHLPAMALKQMTAKLLAPLAGTHTPLILGPIIAKKSLDFSEALAAINEATTRDSLGGIRLEVVLGHPDGSDGGTEVVAALSRAARRTVRGRIHVRVAASFFIPRPFTPWQRHGQVSSQALHAQASVLRDFLGQRSGSGIATEPEMAQVEAALARGDRRLGTVIRGAWASGCVLDTWKEHAQPELWRRAFENAGLELETYATRPLDDAVPLPWAPLGDPHSDTVISARLPERNPPRSTL